MSKTFLSILDKMEEESIPSDSEYQISNLQQLLLLEISSMIQDQVKIKKCRNCNKYFVVNDKRVAYCSRNIEGDEEKTCYDIGAKEAFKRKTKKDEALNLYNKAYKTHYARFYRIKTRTKNKKAINKSYNDFNTWCNIANKKLHEVREGKLDIDTFREWLKE